MRAKPTPEHGWLHKLIGSWEGESSCSMGPDQPPMLMTFTEVFRAVGDVWVVGDGTISDGDDAGASVMTLGFDPKSSRYTGTWIGSPMAHLVVYDGERKEGSDTLVLNAEAPHYEDPSRMATYQDIVEFVGPDERLLRSQMKQDDGSWSEFMRIVYKRVRN
ncbi:MAG: DUF1579 domain-containing protein [Planctomycetota bacterium]